MTFLRQKDYSFVEIYLTPEENIFVGKKFLSSKVQDFLDLNFLFQ